MKGTGPALSNRPLPEKISIDILYDYLTTNNPDYVSFLVVCVVCSKDVLYFTRRKILNN